MNEPLNEKAPGSSGGEEVELAHQSSQLEAYKTSDYPGWSDWELRWREIIAAAGTVITTPSAIRGTRLERWALDRQCISNLSTHSRLCDTDIPPDFGICGIYAQLPRPTRKMLRRMHSVRGELLLCSCFKQYDYAMQLVKMLHRIHHYKPHVWALMVRELENVPTFEGGCR